MLEGALGGVFDFERAVDSRASSAIADARQQRGNNAAPESGPATT